MTVTNKQFLDAIFKEDAPQAHVTDFHDDPNAIPPERHMIAWCGGYFKNYIFGEQTNQYLTISTFAPDENGRARRRKALFEKTHCIVLDDVNEKIPEHLARMLPYPSWILLTSAGSEQWGYILQTPCTDRNRVENLLDGLVANGLAPKGKDPGMKGVTRYVRLPEGVNTKSSRLVDGQPFKCEMLEWNPFNTVTMEELAAPFHVELDKVRKEFSIEGAANVEGSPLLDCGIEVKEVRSDGRYEIVCPWVHEHTDEIDNGAAIFTNGDGSNGFKCHHGNCEDRKFNPDLLEWLEEDEPGFNNRLRNWQTIRELAAITGKKVKTPPKPPSKKGEPEPPVEEPPADPLQGYLDELMRIDTKTPVALELAEGLLRKADDLKHLERTAWHKEVRGVMGWTAKDLEKILKEYRVEWYSGKDHDFYEKWLYVSNLDRFYSSEYNEFLKVSAFQNTYAHLDLKAKENAIGGQTTKVMSLDYRPDKPATFEEAGALRGNTWCDENNLGVEGDASFWLDHFDRLGWGDEREHILKYMAYTILHPEHKINHALLFGGREGTGKDYLLEPLRVAMGRNHYTTSSDAILSDFDTHLLRAKHLHINEIDIADVSERKKMTIKLKSLTASPPVTLELNIKGLSPINIMNLVNVTMCTNQHEPFRMDEISRRYFMVWTDLVTRDSNGNLKPEWEHYWTERWGRMKDGVDHCIWYLRNKVDISNFNPGSPPPVTNFLRETHEASKSPLAQTLEAFIDKKHGNFKKDLMTTKEMLDVLCSEIGATDRYINPAHIDPRKVSSEMAKISRLPVRTAQVFGKTKKKIWILRDFDRYNNMKSTELYAEWEK